MIYILLIIILLVLSIIDEKSRMVPEGLSLLCILIALNTHAIFGTANLSIIGLTVGVLSVWLISQTGIIKLGGGDTKVIGLIGACLGWVVSLETLVLSVLLYRMFFFKRNKTIAFVPVIFEAFIIVSIGVFICHLVKLFSQT